MSGRARLRRPDRPRSAVAGISFLLRLAIGAVAGGLSLVAGVVAVVADLSWSLDDRAIEPVSLDPVFPFGPH